MSDAPSPGLFTIGEFSRVTGITVKGLRFYHEQDLLVPSLIDPHSGYRYYSPSLVDRARAIAYLRSLEFPLDQIREILSQADRDQGRLLNALQEHKTAIEQRIRQLRGVVRSLDQFIDEQKEIAMAQSGFEVEEKMIDPILIAVVRMKGRYSDCSKGFAKIGRSFGRDICGPAMMLHYDAEYKENDADFEACMPIKRSKTVDGVSVRQLERVRCICLRHKGPYEQLGVSYARALKHIKDKAYTVVSPTREIYLKGPGMIFKGNPKNYLTEIQIPIGQ